MWLALSMVGNLLLVLLVVGVVRIAVSECRRANTAIAWVPKEDRHNIPVSILKK